MQFSKAVGFVVIVFCIFFATVAISETQESLADTGAVSAEADARKLIERVEARWAAMADVDFKSAYQFETPAYKSVYSWKQYRAGFGTNVGWLGAKVRKVELHEDLQAEPVAKVLVAVRYVAMVGFEEKFESERVLSEKWLKEGDEWYHLQD